MGLEPNQIIHIVYQNRLVTSRVIRSVRNEVYIDALHDAETELTPMPGQKVPFRWSEDDALYEQEGLITDVLDPIPIMVVHMEGKPRVVELRKSYRIKAVLPVEYGLLRPDSELLVTTTLDISLTGLRFRSGVKLWNGLEMKMRVRIEQRTIEMAAKVVRVAPKPREIRGRESWETAVHYLHMSANDRAWLEQYLRRQHARSQVTG